MKKKLNLIALAISACLMTTSLMTASAIAANYKQASVISTESANQLIYIREEEKLARDVYRTLYQYTSIPTFSRITQSEQKHMDAMAQQLTRFNLADPVKNDATGVFTNPELTQMYQELIKQGSTSTLHALSVGAYIEELDILDLQKAIAQTTDAGLKRAYENLMKGSRNHLRAFVRQITQQGKTYEAQLMSQAEVDSILASAQEPCDNNNKGRGQGRGQRRV